MSYPDLETERLVLSELIDTDIDAVYEIFSDESVLEYYDLEAFKDVSQAQELIAHFNYRYESAVGIRWGIREKSTDRLVGTCGFNSWDIPMKSAVIGYEIQSKHWQRGIAREAVGAMLQAGFDGALNCGPIHRVQADTIPGNAASERLLLSLGFQLEGLRRDCGYWKNAFHDLKCFGLLAHEYNRR